MSVSVEEFQKVVRELESLKLAIPAIQQAGAVESQSVKDQAKKETIGYLTDKYGYKELETYKGKSEDYEIWRFVFSQFLREENGWEALLLAAESWLNIPTDAMVK